MKRIFTLLLLTSALLSFSQNSKVEYENFKLQDNKDLIWRKVYELKGSKDSITKLLKESLTINSFLSNLEYSKYSFNGFSNYTKISDLSGLPMAVYTDFNCFISIDVKENKYRISISNVKFKPMNMNLGLVEMNTNYVLEDISVRDNHHEIRKNKTARRVLLRLNKDFIKMLKLQLVKKDNW